MTWWDEALGVTNGVAFVCLIFSGTGSKHHLKEQLMQCGLLLGFVKKSLSFLDWVM